MHQDEISEQISAGGGCMEAWEASAEVREDSSMSRRELMKKTASGTAGTSIATVLSTGVVQASPKITLDDLEKSASNYESKDDVESAIESFSTPVLEALSAQGVVESAEASELNITEDELTKPTEFAGKSTATTVYGMVYQDTPATHIKIAREYGEYKVIISIRPDFDESFAIVGPKDVNNPLRDDENRYAIIDPDNGWVDDVATSVQKASGTTEPDGNESANPGTEDITVTPQCLDGGCCEAAADSQNTYCVYVNFECCPDGSCVDLPDSGCSGCTVQGCFCECP